MQFQLARSKVYLHTFKSSVKKENRAPSAAFASFDAEGYLAANADVAAAVTAGVFSSALDHFISFGQNETRSGSGISGTTEQLGQLLLLLRVLIV